MPKAKSHSNSPSSDVVLSVPTSSTLTEQVDWNRHLFSFLNDARDAVRDRPSCSLLGPYARHFSQWLKEYLTLFGPLHVHVRPFALLVEEYACYIDESNQGFPYRLFTEGVTSITFTGPLSESETHHLFGLLLLPSDSSHFARDIDLSVRIWEASFSHVDMNQIDAVERVLEDVLWEREQLVEALYHQVQSETSARTNFQGLPDTIHAASEEDEASQTDVELSLREQKAVQELLAGEESTLALRANEIFMLMLAQIKTAEEVEPLYEWIQPVADTLWKAYEFQALAFLVDDLLELGAQLQPRCAAAYRMLQHKLLHGFLRSDMLVHLHSFLRLGEGISTFQLNGLRMLVSILVNEMGAESIQSLRKAPNSSVLFVDEWGDGHERT